MILTKTLKIRTKTTFQPQTRSHIKNKYFCILDFVYIALNGNKFTFNKIPWYIIQINRTRFYCQRSRSSCAELALPELGTAQLQLVYYHATVI
jgi:hypothetical protein